MPDNARKLKDLIDPSKRTQISRKTHNDKKKDNKLSRKQPTQKRATQPTRAHIKTGPHCDDTQ